MQNDKLTQNQRERLLGLVHATMELDALRQTDALKLIDVLQAACRREKAGISEMIMEEQFRIQ